jgi:hypothetical protein
VFVQCDVEERRMDSEQWLASSGSESSDDLLHLTTIYHR